MQPTDLTKLNQKEFKQFMDSFDHVLSDCDGVIWTSSTPLPGSGKFFEHMKKIGKSIHYVSNNSLRDRANYEKSFKAVGIDDGCKNLTTPSIAVIDYLESINFNKKIYCVTCNQTKRDFESHGFQCEDGPNSAPDDYHDLFPYLQDDTEIGAVVFDSDYKVNMAKLYRAITYLKRPDVLFLSGATDRIVPCGHGTSVLGPGVFTDLVIEESKRKPIQLGKPGKEFANFAMKKAGVTDPSRVLFIGDMIEQDVKLGKVAGFITLLLLNTVTYEAMVTHPTIKPDYFAPSLDSILPSL